MRSMARRSARRRLFHNARRHSVIPALLSMNGAKAARISSAVTPIGRFSNEVKDINGLELVFGVWFIRPIHAAAEASKAGGPCRSGSQPVLIGFERYLRGLRDSRRLAAADYVIVSFGKSGRTWLRLLVSRYFQLRYQLPTDAVFRFKNLSALNSSVPAILFTHDNYLSDFTRDRDGKSDYHGKSVVMLIR